MKGNKQHQNAVICQPIMRKVQESIWDKVMIMGKEMRAIENIKPVLVECSSVSVPKKPFRLAISANKNKKLTTEIMRIIKIVSCQKQK